MRGTPTSLSILYCVSSDTYRVRVLPGQTAADREDVRTVDRLRHGARLAGINHEEKLVVPPLFPHLLDSVRCVSVLAYPNRAR